MAKHEMTLEAAAAGYRQAAEENRPYAKLLHPLEAMLEDRLVITGISGSGKTYAAGGAVEEICRRSWRFVVLDPLGVWWGLRHNAAGDGPGYDVVIFGGPRGDIPITEYSGAAIAEAVAKASNIQCVVDLSEIGSLSAMRRFATEFLRTLYEVNREPLHLIVDEADIFAPQNPQKGFETLLHTTDTIVRRGRARGFVPWLITQRPAVLNKNVLSQADTMVALQLTSAQDRAALRAWIEGQADRAEEKDFIAALPKLEKGRGILWSPRRGQLVTTGFPKKVTFDSSRTPKRGEVIRNPVAAAPLDLSALRATLDTVVAEAEANDAGKLKARIVGLEREVTKLTGELQEARNATVSAAAIEEARSEAFALGRAQGHADAREHIGRNLTAFADAVGHGANTLLKDATAAREAAKVLLPKEAAPGAPTSAPTPPPARSSIPDTERPPPRSPAAPIRHLSPGHVHLGDGARGGGVLRVVKVLAQRYPAGLPLGSWAIAACLNTRGGTWRRYLSTIRTEKLAALATDMRHGLWIATHAGREQSASLPEQPRTFAAIVEAWKASLGGGPARLLDTIVEHDARGGIDRANLADLNRMTVDGGTFRRYLSDLTRNNLVRSKGRKLDLTDDLRRLK